MLGRHFPRFHSVLAELLTLVTFALLLAGTGFARADEILPVPPDQNLPEIEKALQEAKNKDYTVKMMPGLNHLLQPAQTGAISEYASTEITIDPSALETIRDWIRQRFVKN